MVILICFRGAKTIVEGAMRAENRNVYSVLRKATGDLSVMEQTCHYIYIYQPNR